jgi:hypothetical protein
LYDLGSVAVRTDVEPGLERRQRNETTVDADRAPHLAVDGKSNQLGALRHLLVHLGDGNDDRLLEKMRVLFGPTWLETLENDRNGG